MVKSGQTEIKQERVYDARHRNSLHRLIIVTPLVIAAVFSLGFTQFFSQESKPVLTSNEEESSQTKQLDQLPIVIQPSLPTLDQTIEVIVPPLPDSNPESRFQTQQNNEQGIGPSSKDALKTLQGVHNSQNSNKNDLLQGTSQRIKLEDAKL